MVTHQNTLPLDPAADAAALLRRLGIAILVMLIPATAFLSRRATVVLAPVGIALLILSSVIEAPPRGALRVIFGLLRSPAGIGGVLFVAWSAAAVFWSPDQGEAWDKLFNMVQAAVLALLGVSMLPERVRASNLYLTGVGVAISALLAIGLLVTRSRETLLGETAVFERGLAGLVLLLWPALAWLESRGRRGMAVMLALAAALALVIARVPETLAAAIFGAVIYAFAMWRPEGANRFVAWLVAGVLLCAPLLAVLASPLLNALLAEGSGLRQGIAAWNELMTGAVVSYIIGHGLDTVLLARLSSSAPAYTPVGLPFEVWYELGAVGALLLALALYLAIRGFGATATGPAGSAQLVPGLLATAASAFVLACLGAGLAFPWWMTTLAIVIIAFAAIKRGQFRTRRPKARGPVAGPVAVQ